MLHSAIREPLNRLCCSCVREEPLIDNNEFTCQPVKVGDSILLYGRRKSFFPFQCLLGPDWPIVVLVYFLIVAIDGVVLYVVSPLGWVPVLIGAVGATALLLAYSSVACSDPGIVYKNDYMPMERSAEMTAVDVESCCVEHTNSHTHSHSHSEEEHTHTETQPENAQNNGNGRNNDSNKSNGNNNSTGTFVTPAVVIASHSSASPLQRDRHNLLAVPSTMDCGQCEFKRPVTARHCVHCKTCIDELDHHCPWCGKCIGEKNLKAFHIFINLICLQCYYLIGVFVYYMIFAFTNSALPGGNKF